MSGYVSELGEGRERILRQRENLPSPTPIPQKPSADQTHRLRDLQTKLLAARDNLSAHSGRVAQFEKRLPAARDRLAERERTTDPDAPRDELIDFSVEKLRVQFMQSFLVSASQQREVIEKTILAVLTTLGHLVREIAPDTTIQTPAFLQGHTLETRIALALAAIEQFLNF